MNNELDSQTPERKMVTYVQCKIQKGIFHKSSWLPESYAVKGQYVRLSKSDSTGNKRWDYGWLVIDVSNKTEDRESYKNHKGKEKDESPQKI